MNAFRRALTRLADDVGSGDPDRLPAVRHRARAIVVRRRAIAGGTAVLACAALAGAFVARPQDRSRDTIYADQPTGDPTVSESPSPSPSPTPSPSSPTASPTTVPPSTSSGGGPGPAGSTEPVVTLALVHPAVTGADTVVEAHVVDPLGSVAALQFSFGLEDPQHPNEAVRSFPGAGDTNYLGDVDRTEEHCGESLAAPTDRRIAFPRRYRVPGTYTAWVRVQTRSCAGYTGGGGERHLGGQHVVQAFLRYTVTGRLWPNGPDEPTATIGFRHTHWEAPDEVDDGPGVQVRAYDDGDVATVHVDWGDGSAEDVAFGSVSGQDGGYNDCERPNEFRDATQTVVAKPDHTYANPGPYTVTVTVTTASCDGTDRQSTTTSGTWDWPPPSEPPGA